MVLKYYLQTNGLNQAGEKKAIIKDYLIHNKESIIDQMLKRGSTLSRADILASLEVFFDVVTDEIASGNHVNLPLVNIKPGIGGTFTNAADKFDAARHTVKATISPGVMLRKKLVKARVELVDTKTPQPLILQFTDIESGTINKTLTPRSIGKVNGYDLKFNAGNQQEGLFFTDADGNVLKADHIARLLPSELMFKIPDLAPGNYTLSIVKAYGKDNILRTAFFGEKLSVI